MYSPTSPGHGAAHPSLHYGITLWFIPPAEPWRNGVVEGIMYATSRNSGPKHYCLQQQDNDHTGQGHKPLRFPPHESKTQGCPTSMFQQSMWWPLT